MAYNKQTWANFPSTSTPISAARLEHMETQYDEAVSNLESRVSNEPTPGSIPTRVQGGRMPGIGTPTQGTDATNKTYVDNAVASGSGTNPLSPNPDPNSVPVRGVGGRITGAGTPTAPGDAANKSYVDAAMASFSSSAASIDELSFSTLIPVWYNGENPVTSFSVTSVMTLMVAPFELDVTSVDLSFERYNLPRNASNYARAWIQRVRPNAENAPLTTQKNTSTGSGGEAITARQRWSITDQGFIFQRLQKGDLLALVLGVTGSPESIKLPVTATVCYRPA